ncbi:ricin-type beta-trefoil lectin domain protein [Kitasatospora azatica]|uniref:ricin-type beta-trefoil lectin domain protein n=1 Tax=Kitasatospora azatica TaxID=58347 RepID=UPI0012F7F2F7|nr:ricin-type beta-trefoil lectin domain protein [Kitasatospora azatica]
MATLATVIGGLAAPAFADSHPGQLPPGKDAPPAASQPTDAQMGPTQRAQAKAKKTGQPVTVDELTTETNLTVANPDGSMTVTKHLQAARVKKNGKWTNVDATLTKNGDGTLSPAAAASGVTLSGGGSTAPLAAFTDKAGHKFSFTLPFALPAPTINGDTASYANVLPGVDLNATVTDQGAFREVLVVHDAAAAANPALKTLRLATSTNGLSTSSDQDGNLTLKAADGAAAFTAPAPVMWDSASTPAPATNAPRASALAAETAPKSAPVSPAAPAAPQAVVDPAGTQGSSKDGPGHGAHISKLAVKADSSSISLTPDANQLADPNLQYPIYYDPYVSPVTGGTNHYTEVKEGCPSQALYDQAQTNGEAIGYQQYDSNCFGLYRTYYEFDTSYTNSSMVIQNSTAYFTETYGADHGCSNTWGVGLNLTGGIGGGTTWASQPGYVAGYGAQDVPSAAAGCGNRPVNFDITSAVSQHLGYNNLTFLLYGNESKYSTNYGFMRFSTNPYVVTKFDIAPNTPDQTVTSPNSQNPSGPDCNGGPAGWIGMTTLNGNASNITLSAHLTTQMSGVNLQAGFHVWDNMVNNGSGGPATATWPVGNWVGNGGTSSANIGGPVSDGHTYGWNAWASDGTLNSGGSSYCYFTADLSAPKLASFTSSTAFPPLGSGITPTAHAGDTGISLQVSSIDPTPTGCNLAACLASGVAGFQWSLDSNIPVSGYNYVAGTAGSGGSATANIPVNLTASQWGTHTLYVRAVDNAGNTQPTSAQYSFYAPWNANTKVVAGDLNGDGTPDLITPGPDGNLSMVPGNSDPNATPQVASTPAQSPDGTSWNNYLVTHRGNQSQSTVDDILAFQKNTKQLYLYRNDGTTGGTNGKFTNTANVGTTNKPTCVPTAAGDCTGYNSTDWSSLTQLVAPGAFSGAQQYADLITVENGKLWYYTGSARSGVYLGKAYQIGTGDWNITSLIAPGTVGATVANGTTTGGTPTLWVRNTITGAISSFPLSFDASGLPNSNLVAPTRNSLTSGITASGGGSLCLDVSGANTANGTKIQLYTCNGSDAQSFTVGADNTLHVLGKCVDVPQGSLTHGTGLQLYTCNNTGSQKWVYNAALGTLVNPQSNFCMADPASNQNPGTQVVTWECGTGYLDQKWTSPTGANTSQPVLPLGLVNADNPVVSSPGDVNADGNPDLYTVNGPGQINEFAGAAPTSGGLAQFTNYYPQYVGALHQANANWPLTAPVGGVVTDTVGLHNGTVKGNVTFPTDTVNGVSTTVASFTGGTGNEIDTAGQSVDTNRSFSITLWTKETSNTGGVVVSQEGTYGSGFIIWPEMSDSTWRFAMKPADDNAWGYDQTTATALGSAAKVTLNQWTKLTASFDATTGRTSLWVNGVLAGTGQHDARPGITGPLVVGRYKYNSLPQTSYQGSVSNLTVNDFAIPVTTNVAMVHSALTNKCLDNNNGSTTNGTHVQVWDCSTSGATGQQWVINANGTITNNGACMDATGNGTLNGTMIEIWQCNGGANQQWVPRANGSLYNPASGRCLDDPNASTTNGTQLELYDCNGTPAQTWAMALNGA